MQEIRISLSLRNLDVKPDLLFHLGLWPDPTQVATGTCWGDLFVLMTWGISEPTRRVSPIEN